MSYATRRISTEDLTGQIFGLRTVLRYKGLREGREYWECQCRCGNIKFVQATALKAGKAKSCGCLRAETVRKYNERRRGDPWLAEMNTHAYRVGWERAHKNKPYKTWGLTLEQYKGLSTAPCFYCGATPSGVPSSKVLQSMGVLKSGIDRKVNSKGYDPDNCVPCCRPCNLDKGTMSMCEFIEKTVRRYEHLKAHHWLQPEHLEDEGLLFPAPKTRSLGPVRRLSRVEARPVDLGGGDDS